MRKGNKVASLCLVLLVMILCTLPSKNGRAEIYRWVDENGVIHYTDSLMNIPEKYKNKAEKPKLPEINTYEEPSPVVSPATGEEPGAKSTTLGKNLDEIRKELEILKAQIEAKKELIESVENKRNLAINPFRNRIIPPEDLKLYEKYKKELPQDEKRLEELTRMLSEELGIGEKTGKEEE